RSCGGTIGHTARFDSYKRMGGSSIRGCVAIGQGKSEGVNSGSHGPRGEKGAAKSSDNSGPDSAHTNQAPFHALTIASVIEPGRGQSSIQIWKLLDRA